MLSKNINKNNILRAILSFSAPPLLFVYTVAILYLTLNIFENDEITQNQWSWMKMTINSSDLLI